MTDPLMQTLLARAAGGGGIGLQDLLPQLGGEDADPRMAMIAQILAQREAAAAAAETADDTPEEPPTAVDGALVEREEIERRESVQRLRTVAVRMYAELEDLRARNDALAAALGACYLCWGEDVQCPVCHGHGQPGARAPDAGLFAEYVAPAVRRTQRPRAGTPRHGTPAPAIRTERGPIYEQENHA